MNKILQISSSILLVLIIIMIGILIANRINKKYVYIDMYGSNGKSSSCYYDNKTKDLRCMIPVQVQQFYEEK